MTSEVMNYAAGHTYMVSVELPAVGKIVEVRTTIPYMAVSLTFDFAVVADLRHDTPDMLSFSVS